jgi:hypothetical protein
MSGSLDRLEAFDRRRDCVISYPEFTPRSPRKTQRTLRFQVYAPRMDINLDAEGSINLRRGRGV